MSEVIDEIERALDEHGHLHVTIEELGERDVQKGMVEGFNEPMDGWFVLEDEENQKWRIDSERVICWYVPMQF